MAVVVKHPDGSKASGSSETTHDDGKVVLVREGGHLFVQSRMDAAAAYTVAVYAPGSWHAVTNDDKQD